MAKTSAKTADKPESEAALPGTFNDLTKGQIAIYAKELNEHFRKERGLRVNLQARDKELEQRAREVTALNNMLQQHLLEWQRVAQEYREVLTAIREMLGDLSMDEGGELRSLIDNVVSNTSEPNPSELFGP